MWILVPAVALAGLLRGYTGFGFAAVAVVGMNLFLTPQQSIPVILGLDLLCSFPLWHQAVRQADMPTFKFLALGSLLGTPLGLWLLLLIPSEVLKLVICVSILVLCLLLAMNIRFRGTDKVAVKLGCGVLAGAATSGSSVGGPMVVCYMLSSALSPMTQRATMILFFVVSELIAMAAMFISGLVGVEVLTLVLILLFPTLLAVRGGQWLFNRYPPSSFKRFALPIMTLVALLGVSAAMKELI
jgi:uncharacterized membrane protein YfcA